MRLTRNPYRIITAVIIAEASLFMLCAYGWGPHHTPAWVVMPYTAMMVVSVVVYLVGASRTQKPSS